MERCHRCGMYAVLGLAHIHGDPINPLCFRCTKELMEKKGRKGQKLLDVSKLAKKAA